MKTGSSRKSGRYRRRSRLTGNHVVPSSTRPRRGHRPPKHERVLRFNCSDPYVLAEFEAAAHGVDLVCAIRELDEELRKLIK